MEEEYYDNMPPNEGQNSNMPPPEEELPEEERFFKDFTNQDIDNHDPSLGKDLIKIYEEEVPFEIRKEDEEISNSGTFESLLCKILTSDDINKEPHTTIEIACDKDLFFYYSSDINAELFENLKSTQKLTCNFDSFSDLLINFFDSCIKDTKKFLAVFTLNKEGNAKMELFENLEHKFGELISLDFKPVSDDIIRQQISYRYNAMRATNDIVEKRIQIVNDVLKDMDPQLIFEVKKDTSKVKAETYIRDKPIIPKA